MPDGGKFPIVAADWANFPGDGKLTATDVGKAFTGKFPTAVNWPAADGRFPRTAAVGG